MTTACVAPALAGPLRSALVVGASSRRALWLLLVAIQLINAAVLGLLASIYFMRHTRGSLLWISTLYFLFADAYAFIDRFYFVVAIVYTLLSVGFSASGLWLAFLSLRHRDVRFGTSSRLGHRWRSKSTLARAVFSPFRFEEWAGKRRWRRIVEWWNSVSFMIGIHGPLFDVRYVLERIVTVATQTIAAYSSSRSISNVWLNQTYGIVLFLSCAKMPVVARIFRGNSTKQRLAYLVTDLSLSFVWGTIVPLWMYAPVVYAYYSDVSTCIDDNLTSYWEVQRVLVVSWSNFIVSVIPYISALLSSLEIQDALETQWPSANPSRLGPRPAIDKPKRSVAVKAVLNFSTNRVWASIAFVLHAVVAVYGCAILLVSLSANDILGRMTKQAQFPCIFRLHPWFSTKEACVKRYVNCTTVELVGTSVEIETALALFDGDSLSDLHLQSCSALEVPASLHRFVKLVTLVIQDSWITAWPLSANVTSEVFQSLKTVKLLGVDTNTTLHGLVSVPIPDRVEYIRFFEVPNAESILRPVGSNWQHIQYFDCDSCNLVDVPLAVNEMHQLQTLSLADSRIVRLRDDWITNWDLKFIGLWMDGNKELTDLSDEVWRQAATCSMFSMMSTNLSTIPEWVPSIARADFVVYGYDSPLCNEGRIASSQVDRLVVCEDQNDG